MGAAYEIEPGATRVVVRTRAEGLFSRLAHDLEIVAHEGEGRASVEGEGAKPSGGRIELSVPVEALRVAGVLRRGKVETGVLSPSDVAEIEKKIAREVLPVTAVRAEGEIVGEREADVRVSLGGKSQRTRARISVEHRPGGYRISGTLSLSLSALGVSEVKGPLGAFRVADDVDVAFELTLRPEG